MTKVIISLFLLLFLISCKGKTKVASDFSTYYIEQAQHTITFYEHYIYLDLDSIKTSDSLTYLNKIKSYVDTVNAGKPIISVSIVNNLENFPDNPDGIDWPKVMKARIFAVSFNEDSLANGAYYINHIRIFR
jgi:hypothetical protein